MTNTKMQMMTMNMICRTGCENFGPVSGDNPTATLPHSQTLKASPICRPYVV